MHLHRSAGTHALWAALACVLLLALVGCVTGGRVQASFIRQSSNDPAVERLEPSTVDNMPFTGGFGGAAFLHDNLSETEVREFAEQVRGFGE